MRLEYVSAGLRMYKHYLTAPLLFTLLFCITYTLTNHDPVAAYAGKIATTLFTCYSIYVLRGNELYYYYNLHISRRVLFACFFITDLLVFTLCLWIIHRFL